VEQQDAAAMNALATCLENGKGIARNYNDAFRYYETAARLGYSRAKHNLGRCYEHGIGTARNLKNAAYFYRLAAGEGIPDAQNSYAICLQYGFGVEANPVEAAKLYELAAREQNPDAEWRFGLCRQFGVGVPVDLNTALAYFSRAAEHGHRDAKIDWRRLKRLCDGSIDPNRPGIQYVMPRERPRSDDPMERTEINCEQPQDLEECRMMEMDEIDVIGPIGGGRVELVRHRPSGKKYAMKTFVCENVLPARATRCNREVKTLIKLPHPCILPIVGYSPRGSSDNKERIFVEFMPNGSLEDHIAANREKRWSFLADNTNVVRSILELVLGMRFIHRNHGIHRDLKPSNILLDRDWRIRISDFETFKWETSSTTRTTQVGTPCYMAPECYENDGYSRPVDVFSFGLILYELVVARPVFEPHMKPVHIMRRVTTRGPEDLRQIPDDVDELVAALIRRCWAQEPGDRPTFDEIFERLSERYDFLPHVNVSEVDRHVAYVLAWEDAHPSED
jgi:hypothetical protein